MSSASSGRNKKRRGVYECGGVMELRAASHNKYIHSAAIFLPEAYVGYIAFSVQLRAARDRSSMERRLCNSNDNRESAAPAAHRGALLAYIP